MNNGMDGHQAHITTSAFHGPVPQPDTNHSTPSNIQLPSLSAPGRQEGRGANPRQAHAPENAPQLLLP